MFVVNLPNAKWNFYFCLGPYGPTKPSTISHSTKRWEWKSYEMIDYILDWRQSSIPTVCECGEYVCYHLMWWRYTNICVVLHSGIVVGHSPPFEIVSIRWHSTLVPLVDFCVRRLYILIINFLRKHCAVWALSLVYCQEATHTHKWMNGIGNQNGKTFSQNSFEYFNNRKMRCNRNRIERLLPVWLAWRHRKIEQKQSQNKIQRFSISSFVVFAQRISLRNQSRTGKWESEES